MCIASRKIGARKLGSSHGHGFFKLNIFWGFKLLGVSKFLGVKILEERSKLLDFQFFWGSEIFEGQNF